MSVIVKGLSFSYHKKQAFLKELSTEFQSGEISALIGQNGSGKTTFLKCINGILKAEGGEVLFEGKNLLNLSLKQRAKIMSYVPQNIPNKLNLDVFDIVLMGRRPYINWHIGERDKKIVLETLKLLGLESLKDTPYSQLSGGQKQKVLIARALAQETKIIIMDEPTSNLDLKHQLEIFQILKSLCEKKNLTIIITAHDLNLVTNFCSHLTMLKGGEIFYQGGTKKMLTPDKIFSVFDVHTYVGEHKKSPFVLLKT